MSKSLREAAQAVVNAICDQENADKYLQLFGGKERDTDKVARYVAAMDLTVRWDYSNSRPTGQNELEKELSDLVNKCLPQMIATAVECIKARVDITRVALAREMSGLNNPTK